MTTITIKRTEILDNLTNNLHCPISGALYKDPVIAADGFTYEREMIEKWFEWHNTSPLTNVAINTTILIPNLTIKTFVKDFLELEKINKHENNNKTENVERTIIPTTIPITIPTTNTTFKLTKQSLNVTDARLKHIINLYGYNYVDSDGKLLIDELFKITKSKQIINFVIDDHINKNILETDYVIQNNTHKLIHLVCKYCCMNSEKFIKKLAARECNLEASTSLGWKPIHLVCKYGGLDSIMYLVKKKVNVDEEIITGFNTFCIICRYGTMSSIKCIIWALKNKKINYFRSNLVYKHNLKENKNLSFKNINEIEDYLADNCAF